MSGILEGSPRAWGLLLDECDPTASPFAIPGPALAAAFRIPCIASAKQAPRQASVQHVPWVARLLTGFKVMFRAQVTQPKESKGHDSHN